MRRLSWLLVMTLCTLAAAPAGAQQIAQATSAAARAGVAAAVKGDVKLAAVPGVRAVGKDVVSGDAIFLGDQVTTGSEGRLQIMLLDETVFTIGPNAALVIDQFVFDPETSAGKVTATVLKGTFRFVTGKVAKRQPSDMEVKLPVGSIGVRGTSVAGETDGTRATVVLLGPGPETNSNERVGRILVTGTGPGGSATTVEIVRPGYGTEISGLNVPPGPPVRIDPARISAITAPLAGTGPRAAAPEAQQGQGQGPQPGQAAPGQQAGPAPQAPGPQGPGPQGPAAQGPAPQGGPGGAITFARAPVNPAGGLAGIRTVGALAPANHQAQQVAAGAQQQPPSLPSGPVTHEQLKTISSGSATFQANNVPLAVVNGTGNPGSFNYQANIDFGARTVSMSLTGNYVLNGTPGNINLSHSDSYANKTGPVSSTPMTLNNGNAGIPVGHTGALLDVPRNANGKIASVIDIKLQIWTNGANCHDGGAHCVAGERLNVPRGP